MSLSISLKHQPQKRNLLINWAQPQNFHLINVKCACVKELAKADPDQNQSLPNSIEAITATSVQIIPRGKSNLGFEIHGW